MTTGEADYRKDEQLDVWSNTQQAWKAGVVEEAVGKDCAIDGYAIPARAVKVRYVSSDSTKWVMPGLVASELRKRTQKDVFVNKVQRECVVA